MNEELVTIKTFFYDTDTLLYEPQFQNAEIFYFLKDQKTVAVDPLVSNAIGGIKLQVRKEDVEKAMVLVEEIEKNRAQSESERIIAIDDKVFESVLEECPKCGSENVYEERYPFFKALFSKKNYYCKDCKSQWK